MGLAGRLAVAGVAVLGLFPGVAGAATQIGGVNWSMTEDGRFASAMGFDCRVLIGRNWGYDGFTYAGLQHASGTWDPVKRMSSVQASGPAIQFDKLPGGSRPFALTNPGFAFAGGKLYLTGEFRPAKTRVSAARRLRAAVITKMHLESGPGLDRRDKPIPGTWVFVAQGDVRATPALANAVNRSHCPGRANNVPSYRRKNQLHVGQRLGTLTAQILPSALIGNEGKLNIHAAGLRLYTDAGDVDVAATGGATKDSDGAMHFPLPSGAKTPLTCNLGSNCDPTSGSGPTTGALTFSYGGRTATLDNLAVSFTRDARGGVYPTLAGNLDGAAVTIAGESGNAQPQPTDDFLARVGTALGVRVGGTLSEIEMTFGSVGPVP